jgi:Fic family protein
MPQYDRTVPHNSLPFLPPPNVEHDPDIMRKLVTASRALASVNYNVLRIPNPLMLINTIALQEARTSTEIENIFTTEDELYKAVSDTAREDRSNVATKEVLRYREALWAGYGELKQKGNVDVNLIISIFQQIKDTTTGLRPPQAIVVIKRGESEFRAGETIYTPPWGAAIVGNLMENLVEYLNDDIRYPTDPLLKMCISHYQFEAIHPFQDGNGRTGRILNLLYLVNQNLLTQPVLYLSQYIIRNKEDYYNNLAGVTQRGDWKTWILFMLDAVEKTAIVTSNLIDTILTQMAETLSYGKKNIKWYSKEINEALYGQPYSKPKVIADVISKSSRTTVTKYMDELVKARILVPRRDGKEVYYLNEDLIRILQS